MGASLRSMAFGARFAGYARARFAFALTSCALFVAGGACSSPRAPGDAATARTLLASRVPLGLGAARAVAVLAQPGNTAPRVFSRAHDEREPTSPLSLARLPVVLAALRTGRLQPGETFACTGFRCVATHGPVGVVPGLSMPCLAFVDDLARRIGAPAIGAAFSVLGLTPPPIADDPEARALLATRGRGWLLTAMDALVLARSLSVRPAPWFQAVDDALMSVPATAAPMHGLLAADDAAAWFVGYVRRADPIVLAVHVAECTGRCVDAAIAVARWSLARVAPGVIPTVLPPNPPAASPRGTRSPGAARTR